ncbi:MAG: ComEA family DNA-binding protein [Lachnospiraceae bacterium]|nr:ComEA family DNA-binding protein [Lachnospiraceae bacterium]
MKKSQLNILAVFILSIVLTFLTGCAKEDAVIELDQEGVLNDPEMRIYDELPDGTATYGSENGNRINKEEAQEPLVITVYVCGAVNHSGVYELKGQPRVVDAIEAAGGMNELADKDYSNQAMLLTDGQKIYVPSCEETEQMGNKALYSDQGLYDDATAAGSGSTKVNINTADISQLMTLPGIGEAKAALIIEYRNDCGRFDSIEDIMKINGIKEGMFNKIRDKICI